MSLVLPAQKKRADFGVGEFLRFACSHCRKVLKVRAETAGASGGRGRCPQCRGEVEFEAMHAQMGRSWMGRAILRRMSDGADAKFAEQEFRRLGLLLSQGTCRDYGLAGDLLAGRKLPARQWRRVLHAAAVQEGMRRRIETVTAAGETAVGGFSLCADNGEGGADAAGKTWTPRCEEIAWDIMARFVYQQKHGVCAACQGNPTGLACADLEFERFCGVHEIAAERAERWRGIIRRQVGV